MARKPTKSDVAPSGGERVASGIDPVARASNILQLRRARGQIDGIERMIANDRYCADIILQIIAVRASVHVVAKSLLEAHLRACHNAARGNGGAEADRMYQELVDLVGKLAR